MPRSREANQQLREASRAQLLLAALKLFSRRGFDGTSVREIAREAGVSLGLLYAHYDSKESVLRALIGSSALDVAQTLEAAEEHPTAAGFVTALLQSGATLLDSHRDLWRLGYALRHQPEVLARLKTPLRRFLEETFVRLERGLRRRGVRNARTEALLLFATVDGICQQYVLFDGEYPMDRVIEAAAQRYAALSPRKTKRGHTP